MAKSGSSSLRSCESPAFCAINLDDLDISARSIGALFGIAANVQQEKLYQSVDNASHTSQADFADVPRRKHHAARGPEARLYLAMVSGITFTAALFIYAWCTFAHVAWISLCIAIVVRINHMVGITTAEVSAAY